MYTEDQEIEEQKEYAPDTLLPKDLVEHLEERKIARKEVINTTSKLTGYLVTWSMNATGFFLAKALLLLGGSVNYWLAVSICFTCCAVVPLAGLSDFRVNYDQGLKVDNAQSTIKVVCGLTSAGVTTYLSGQDYRYFQQMTTQTIAEISTDIEIFEKQIPRTNPLDGGLQIVMLGVSAIALLGIALSRGRNT